MILNHFKFQFFSPNFINIQFKNLFKNFIVSFTSSVHSLSSYPFSTMASLDSNSLFDHLGDEWWDQEGPMSGLHQLNPCRQKYFQKIIQEKWPQILWKSKKIIDIGCGGGILAESLCSLGYQDYRAIDISASSIEIAKKHMLSHSLSLSPYLHYQVASCYNIPFPDETFDIVIMSDILEHLSDVPLALSEASRILKHGGLFFFDTINRTTWSWLLIIQIAQESPWRFVPKGCHKYELFITPSELDTLCRKYHITLLDMKGLCLNKPFFKLAYDFLSSNQSFHSDDWVIDENDLSLNYIGYGFKNVDPIHIDEKEKEHT